MLRVGLEYMRGVKNGIWLRRVASGGAVIISADARLKSAAKRLFFPMANGKQ